MDRLFQNGEHTSIFGALGGAVGSIIGSIAAFKRSQINATRILAGFNDKRTVGLLAESLYLKDFAVRKAARDTLMRLLPQLRATDAHLLNERQRECLYRALGGYDGDLILVILKALEQIGDEKALPYVHKLANGGGIATADSRVEAAAVECLPFLQIRIQQQRLSQTLLQGSSLEQTTPEQLLRPAQAAADTPSEQLLRAATGQE